jgi:dTDP-4-amino-4,6-dideoxygalactose transaminase
MWTVPLTDVAMPEEDVEAVLDCLRDGWLTMGPRTLSFEAAFAEYVGAEHAVAVSSGTAALHLAMLAAGIGPGDEVVVPALTFVATAAAVRYVGATPVFCDVRGPNELNVDPESIADSLTARTRAVVAVHFMGYPADVHAIRELCSDRGIALIEDVAQGVGARVGNESAGTVGDLGCFSFFSKKQLCVGEGGMVVTDDDSLAARVRLLRSHAMTSGTWDRHRGYSETYDVVDIGFNYRLDEPRAALGLSRLARLDRDIDARRRTVVRYREKLAEIDGVDLVGDDEMVSASSHFAFPILLRDREQRDGLRAGLHQLGIQTTWYPAVTELTAYRGYHASSSRAELVAGRHCALPLSSTSTSAQLDLVVDAIDALMSGSAAAESVAR